MFLQTQSGATSPRSPPQSPVRTLVVDPFVGSGNTLYWLLRHLPGSRGIGFELDARVLTLTLRNPALLGLPIDVSQADYRTGLNSVSAAEDELIVVFIAPPWGDALDPASGLDLGRTHPPVGEIVEVLRSKFAHSRMLCVVQVFERMNADSLADLTARFDWSGVRM